ncbi:MAG TPA: hypothetical protein VKA74_07780 [Myxococcota bacterium]|nr:hypothetical protein [Myxococcota bacterium]
MRARGIIGALGRAGLLVAAAWVAAQDVGAAEPEPLTETPAWRSEETLRLAPVDFEVPSLREIWLAQADAVDSRRRRRPSFRRPGGSRDEEAGAPRQEAEPESTESAEEPPAREAAPVVAPDESGSSGGAPTPRPESSPPRRPSATRPGSDDSSGSAPEPREARPARRPRRYENELPDYEIVPLPDRWRIVENLGVNERWYDPYNQNTLKADRPNPGTKDWFVNVGLIYDGLVEARRIPTPTGGAGARGREVDLFGDGSQLVTAHTFLASLALIQGDTTFRPPDWEFRITAAANVNYAQINQLGALKVDPRENNERFDHHITIQEAFVDKHLWNRTDRYDFDSLRIGIQPFNADFRGFLFESQEPGVRLFGNFANNRAQYNIAWFRRLNKDTNSGLNDIEALRDDDVVIANFYYQDFPVLGFNVEALFAANINREGDDRDFDDNSNLVIPSPVGLIGGHDYEVYYLGFAGDGHIERLNLSFQLYGALGNDDYNSIAQRSQDIQSFFAAVEASYDIDWMRIKAFGLYSMGDDDPFDDKAQGFDTILDNPNFAGATTSFWQRQQIPFVFGGGVALSGVNSIVPSLRSSKIEGQSNFVNPGLWLVGAGADFDILPELRLITNVSWLSWDSVETLEILRQQERISREIGWDVSAGLIYRPFFTNNIIFRASGAVLIPGSGYEELFDERSDEPPYSVLLNLTLTY